MKIEYCCWYNASLDGSFYSRYVSVYCKEPDAMYYEERSSHLT